MSHRKEPAFFALWYEAGLDAYWRAEFSHWTGQRVVGEASTLYLRLPWVASRIHREIPEAKLIASLRNPVDRAYAEWWMLRLQSHEPRPFEAAIVQELVAPEAGIGAPVAHVELLVRAIMLARERCGEPGLTGYLSGGHYAAQLQGYLDLFPREHVKIVLFEDLLDDPHALLHDLFAFLGVDPLARTTEVTPQNVARGEGALKLSRIPGARRLARLIPPRARAPLRRLFEGVSLRPPMDPTTRQLLLDYFRDHNRALEKILGRDLSHWNR